MADPLVSLVCGAELSKYRTVPRQLAKTIIFQSFPEVGRELAEESSIGKHFEQVGGCGRDVHTVRGGSVGAGCGNEEVSYRPSESL